MLTYSRPFRMMTSSLVSLARVSAGTRASHVWRAAARDIFGHLKVKNSRKLGSSLDPDNSTISNELDEQKSDNKAKKQVEYNILNINMYIS